MTLRRSLAPFVVDVRRSDLYAEICPTADGYVTHEPLDASNAERQREAFARVGAGCTAIITNTPHNTQEASAIVKNLIDLVEGQDVDFVATLFRSIWGAEPGRLPYLNRPSFHGEILCCWRPRWIAGSEGNPMHAYAWYVWRNTPRSGPIVEGPHQQGRGGTNHRHCVRPRRLTATPIDSGNVYIFALKSVRWRVTEYSQ
jgi:hypothetical protein